jgi:radical SAM protein with 4Fe4S-binding SPASM domain
MKKKIPIVTEGPKTYQEFKESKSQSTVNEPFIKNLLKNKVPHEAEIEVSLFQACNLKCAFCWQDHDDTTGLDEIIEKAEPINQFISDNSCTRFNICLMGGEIFQDGRDKFDEYFDLIKKVDDHAKSLSKQANIILVTNCLFTEVEKVEIFLNKLEKNNIEFCITTSIDFHGRAIAHHVNTLWHKNIIKFKKHVGTINLVLTRPTIDKFLNSDTSYFKYLYDEGFPISFDYYTPETNAQILVPSDKEILDFLLKVIDEFPNIQPIKQWIENDINQMTCMSLNKITILPNGRILTCRQLQYDPKEFEHKINYESNANIIESFVTKKECLSCEFFGRCGFSCFVMEDHVYFAQRKQLSECLYKIMFREINKKWI